MPTPLSLENGQLSQQQIDQYWEDGFLFPIPVMSAEEAAQLRAELETIERDYLAADLPQPLNTYKRVNSHLVMPMAANLAMNTRVLDVVQGILGPDILTFSVEFFIKEAQTSHIVSMHQDLTYWGLGAIDGLTTAWIALSPATPASGCMDFVRGSHKNPILPHEDTFDDNNLLSRGQEIQVEVAEEDKVPIEIHPGEMSLHHGLTIHGSGPNTSPDRRIAAVIRFMRPDSVPADRETFGMVTRGADRCRNTILCAPPREYFAPADLALYDEIRASQARVMMAGATQESKVYA